MIAAPAHPLTSMKAHVLIVCLVPALACRAATRPDESPAAGPGERAVAAVLDDWHRAASAADGPRYFGHMASDAVFLGTDARERWSLSDFRAFAEPYFARGVGWTYEPVERHVSVRGTLAWCDETLWNDKYGLCRGTGVLRRAGEAWRIVHYSLTFLVPNEVAPDVVERIGATRPRPDDG